MYLRMGHTFDARNIEIWAYMLYVFYMLNVAHVKMTLNGTLTKNMSRTGLYDCMTVWLYDYD